MLLSVGVMLGKLLMSGEMKQFASFVSPAFFDVLPAKPLYARARELWSASRDDEAFRHATAHRRDLLNQTGLAITVAKPKEGRARRVSSSGQSWDDQARGDRIVTLYFHQLLHGNITLLDLRYDSFDADGDDLRWHPSPWVVEWDEGFIRALRDVYGGFYGRDDSQFRHGLRSLNLEQVEPIFRDHFGGRQTEVRFRRKEFIDTFHKVFVACRDHGTSLHADFLPLGLYLATLYDHLDNLGVSVDVAACFEDARSPRQRETSGAA